MSISQLAGTDTFITMTINHRFQRSQGCYPSLGPHFHSVKMTESNTSVKLFLSETLAYGVLARYHAVKIIEISSVRLNEINPWREGKLPVGGRFV